MHSLIGRRAQLAAIVAAGLSLPSVALAQQAPAAPDQQPPAAQQPAPQSGTAGSTTQTAPANLVATLGKGAIGRDIYDANGEDIAEVEDVVMGANNQIQAVLVDVGGFLGIGEKRVAIPVTDLELRGDRIVAPKLTEEGLEAMPAHSGVQ